MSGWFWPRAIHDHGVDSLSQNYACSKTASTLFDRLLFVEELCSLSREALL